MQNYSNTQIISLYDSDEAITIDAIAAAFGESIETIKMVLIAGSQRYRKETKDNSDLFTESDMALARDTLKQLCFAENEGVRAKVALAIIDEKKGRRDVKHAAKTVGQININVFNQYLNKGKERLKQIKGEVVDAQAV